MTQPYDVEFASEQYQSWLADLKVRAMLQTHNQAQAMMRSVLTMLRRHMTTADVFDFADALPALPRGIFIGGWRPGTPEPVSGPDAFADEVVADLSPHHIPPATIVADALAVIAAHSPPHDLDVLRAATPAPLRALWPDRGEG